MGYTLTDCLKSKEKNTAEVLEKRPATLRDLSISSSQPCGGGNDIEADRTILTEKIYQCRISNMKTFVSRQDSSACF